MTLVTTERALVNRQLDLAVLWCRRWQRPKRNRCRGETNHQACASRREAKYIGRSRVQDVQKRPAGRGAGDQKIRVSAEPPSAVASIFPV